MSSPKLIERRKATKEEWLACWSNCEYATYFQSPMWGDIWESYTKGKCKGTADYLKFNDGSIFIMPYGIENRLKGLITHRIFSQAGTFGGPISENSVGNLKFYEKYFNQIDSFAFRDNPYQPILDESCRGIKKDITHSIHLKSTPSITDNWSSSHKRSLKKAYKNGVCIENSDENNYWEEYYELYQKSINKWGIKTTTIYSKNIFDILRCYPESIKLWVSVIEDKVVAGAIIFYSKKIAIYWHGASDEAYLSSRPVHMLFEVIMEDSKSKKIDYFDFNPSGGLEGVARFKKGFGTKELLTNTFEKTSLKVKILNRLGSSIYNLKAIVKP